MGVFWDKMVDLLLDSRVSEIHVNNFDNMFYKRDGVRYEVEYTGLADLEEYYEEIENNLLPYVDSTHEFRRDGYMFEGDLLFEGVRARTHIMLPPDCVAPLISIAKKSKSLKTLDDIARSGSMAIEMKKFIEAAVSSRLSIVFSGATGAGKTSMLQAVSRIIPADTRIGVAEDLPELDLEQKNVAYLRSTPLRPGEDPNSVVTLDWCVRQFNRMRVDLIIIGETRGKEFASFLTAANSGMEGSMTTIHANSPRRALDRMSGFVLQSSPNVPVRTVNSDISQAIDLIVQLNLYKDTKRYRVESIEEVTQTLNKNQDAKITTNKLYEYQPDSDSFIKKGRPTDSMIKKLSDNGFDYNTVFNAEHNSTLPVYGIEKIGRQYSPIL